MKITCSLSLISLILIFNSSLLTAAAKPAAKSSNGQAKAPLVDTSTRLGKYLNSQLMLLATPPAGPILGKINAMLLKGKELHAANFAFDAALKEQKENGEPVLNEADRLSINAGKTCHVLSTVNHLKAVTPKYRAEKKADCERMESSFPNSHNKFNAFVQGATLKQKTVELKEMSAEFFTNETPAAVQLVVGRKLDELDTLANLIIHLGPSEEND